MGDPGYNLLAWFMADTGLGFFGVTVVSAAAFITGLFVFAFRQPNPWLGVAVAVPYLVIVVGMGYMRQAVALGFIFWGLSRLERGDFKSYVVLVALGATFHTTAIIMIPLGMFIRQQGKLLRGLAIGLLLYGVWDASLAQRADDLWENYVGAQMESQGAMIRVMMNVVPALIFLYYRKEWQKYFPNYHLWLILALGAVAAVPLVGYASTAVDRMSLYATPLQVAVFSRLPLLVGNLRSGSSVVLMVVAGYALVLFVWLNFAGHSGWWLPYRNWLFS
jgi:hypothetical protein